MKKIQAIVQVKSSSSFAAHNYKTYDVKEILNTVLALNINGKTVDFSFNEAIIVNFEEIFQEVINDRKLGLKCADFLFKKLEAYRQARGIILN